MSDDTAFPLDENTRRYYLDVMGVQCWQSLESVQQSNRDVDVGSAVDLVALDWPQIETDIQQCINCPLHKTRKTPMTGRGSSSAELMFVLLAPTVGDDESGVLCSGEANELFSKMLSAINVSIESVYITSLLKCAMPAGQMVSSEEVQSCRQYLQQQIQLIQPKRIVALGEKTIQCLMQENRPLDDYRAMNAQMHHAEVQNKIYSIPLFVSYSPQELLQNPEYKRNAWSDLQQLQTLSESMPR